MARIYSEVCPGGNYVPIANASKFQNWFLGRSLVISKTVLIKAINSALKSRDADIRWVFDSMQYKGSSDAAQWLQ